MAAMSDRLSLRAVPFNSLKLYLIATDSADLVPARCCAAGSSCPRHRINHGSRKSWEYAFAISSAGILRPANRGSCPVAWWEAEVSQTPVRVAIAKAPVECLVARGRCKPCAYVWTIESGDAEEHCGALINPSVASHEMWTMLMEMIPSADAIGQTECDAVQAMGVRTSEDARPSTHAATLSRASGSGSEGWRTRAGKSLAKWTTCSPDPQDIEKDIENEVAIAQCKVGRVLAVVAHLPHGLGTFGLG